MLNAFWWFVTAQAIGLAAFPLAYFLLPRLADRGYTISKPLGVLLLGYATWILSQLHILPSVRLSIVALLLVMGGLSGWYAWGRRAELREFFIRERRLIIASEAVFLAFFVGWTVYRAFDPHINHTEQPMDFAFLNASIRSVWGAPEDPWLRGHSVSYYYFGYWMMGTLSELTGVPSNISYNLSLVLIPAMAAMGVFGLVYNLVHADSQRWRWAIAAGLASAFLLIIVANLEGVLEFMRANGMGSPGFWQWVGIDGLNKPLPLPSQSWAPGEFWWWFRATRVINTFQGGTGIDYTIQEFPFFSFMLGDLHPHVMSIPLVVLFLALAWNFLASPSTGLRDSDAKSLTLLAVTGLALGGLAFTNMWDLPTFAFLFTGMALLKAYRERPTGLLDALGAIIPTALLVIGLAFLLFLPYFLDFRGGVTGIGAVVTAARPLHMLIVWALFFVAVIPFLIGVFWETTVTADWRRMTAVALAVGFLPYVVWGFVRLQSGGAAGELPGRLFHVLPFALLISMAVYSAMWLMKERGPSGRLFAVVLAGLGLLLIMGPELLFIRDSFNTRMNTVFKLYYQSWVLLALASGFAFYYWGTLRASLSGGRRLLTAAWAAAFIVLLAGSLYYPPAAAVSKPELSRQEATLDGLAFVKQTRPAEYEAIQYLKENARRDSAIVESVGEWFDAGLISRSTGIPTVFNWPGHQVQWRGSSRPFEGREQDVTRIYQTHDPDEARSLLEKYKVEFVYVGPREIQKYGTGGMGKFDSFMDRVFDRDGIVIYRMRG